ncbi:MAG: iron chaperone [Micropepsaceae bacterium]
MTQPATSVAAYLKALPAEQRATLERLRHSILAAVPRATERISYGMPAIVLDGRVLVYYGAAAKHCSFYPGSVLQRLGVDIKGYDTSKGTIRFPIGGALPAALVRKIVKARIAQQAAKATQRKAR